MISEKVRNLYEHSGASQWAGHIMLPINICTHCGEADDPKGYWGEDADGDRICFKCEKESVGILYDRLKELETENAALRAHITHDMQEMLKMMEEMHQ